MTRDEQINLVVTGDLTRTGDLREVAQQDWKTNWNEFETADRFMRSQWPIVSEREGDASDDVRFPPYVDYSSPSAIPGNHDHWNGATFRHFSYNEKIFDAGVPRTPWDPPRIIESQNREFKVELFGVDSTAGRSQDRSGEPSRRWNMSARGRIAGKRLERLTELLDESIRNDDGRPCARVLLCHHPPEMTSIGSRVLRIQRLAGQSRRDIIRLAREFKLTAVLTGHTHRFATADYKVAEGRFLREFRSAATLQGPAAVARQGFWAHRIFIRDDGRLWWQALPYGWQGKYFFPANDYEDHPELPIVPIKFPID